MSKGTLPTFYDKNNMFEIGIDEAGRGPLFGRLYVAGVVLPKDGSMDMSSIKDSKKVSKKRLPVLYDYIITHALAYDIVFIDALEIDKINIRQSVLKGMRLCAENIMKKLENVPLKEEDKKLTPFFLLIDGNDFQPMHNHSTEVPFKTFIHGDNSYASIAAASILAKVARDNYIRELCKKYPVLSEKYGMDKHMGYGTKIHLEAIQKYGATQFHRFSYGCCKSADVFVI